MNTIKVSNTADLRTAIDAGYTRDQIEIVATDTTSIATAARAEGVTAGKAEIEATLGDVRAAAAKAERERLAALSEIAEPGFEAEHKAAIEGGHTPEQFALTQMKAAKDRGITIGAIKKDSPRAVHASAPEQKQTSAEAKSGWAQAVAKLGGKKAA